MSHQGEIKNIRGGGVSYVADWKSPQMRLFKAGLRQDPDRLENLTKGLWNRPAMEHDKTDYERGNIIHSRSNANQYFAFHYMYGGFKKYVVQRWWINNFYRRTVRVFWAPFLIAYGIGCYGMRKYDTASYHFFYFSD